MHEVKHVPKEYFPEYRQVRRRVTLYSDKHSNVRNNTSSQPWRTHTLTHTQNQRFERG